MELNQIDRNHEDVYNFPSKFQYTEIFFFILRFFSLSIILVFSAIISALWKISSVAVGLVLLKIYMLRMAL